MALTVEYTPRAAKELLRLPTPDRERIAQRVADYAEEPGGRGHDVVALSARRPGLRLRVGDWRVLFDRTETGIRIERVAHRREAYR